MSVESNGDKPRYIIGGKIYYPTVVRVKINPDGTPVNKKDGIDQRTVLPWSGFDKRKAPKRPQYYSVVTIYERKRRG